MVSEICNALTISDAAIKIARTVKRGKYYLNHVLPPVQIAVYGTSGSGKSRFLSLLSGNPYEEKSTRFYQPIKYTLPNGRRLIFYDCPGQSMYDGERRKIKKKIMNHKIKGVRNVVCYGYNESSNSKLKVFEQEGNSVRKQYIEENLNFELKQLDEWVNDIDHNCRLKWILTLINKADVWSEKADEVESYYTDGDYSKKFSKIERVCRLHTLPYCSIISPFCNRPMTIHIGENEKIKYHLNLVENLGKFVSKHE